MSIIYVCRFEQTWIDIDMNCCSEFSHLVKVLEADAKFDADARGDDAWEQPQEEDGNFDIEAGKKKHEHGYD